MNILQGKGLSGGRALGALYRLMPRTIEDSASEIEDADGEWARFLEARNAAVSDLQSLADKARETVGTSAALLLESHQLIALDPFYNEALHEKIFDSRMRPETAVLEVSRDFAEKLSGRTASSLKTRARDIREVSERILSHLRGDQTPVPALSEPVILAAEDISPGLLLQLEREKILGIVTSSTDPLSHAAILAGIMNIPFVTGIRNLAESFSDHETVLINGQNGTVLYGLTAADTEAFLRASEVNQRTPSVGPETKPEPAPAEFSFDGRPVRVLSSIAELSDLPAVLQRGAAGIGLFRSEFLFLSAPALPDEEAQFQVYRTLLHEMNGRPTVIRTLDIGGDKLPRNPALSDIVRQCPDRGIGFCLSHPEFFLPQLRALLRASVYGNLSILLPMLRSVSELRDTRRLLQENSRKLRQSGLPVPEKIPVGVMIETPEALENCALLSREADFFSLGTNDLSRTFEAQDPGIRRDPDALRKKLLQALRPVGESAKRAGIPLSICGELAADTGMTEALLSVGVDSFTVPPPALPALLRKLGNLTDNS